MFSFFDPHLFSFLFDLLIHRWNGSTNFINSWDQPIPPYLSPSFPRLWFDMSIPPYLSLSLPPLLCNACAVYLFSKYLFFISYSILPHKWINMKNTYTNWHPVHDSQNTKKISTLHMKLSHSFGHASAPDYHIIINLLTLPLTKHTHTITHIPKHTHTHNYTHTQTHTHMSTHT